MNDFNEYERNRTLNLLGLRAFPRSIGMIIGAIALLGTQEPYGSLVLALNAWFVAFLIKSILPPSIVDMNLWSCCSLPINAIAAYPIRWFLYIIMVIIALFIGSPLTETLIAMGGLLLYDMFIVFTRGL